MATEGLTLAFEDEAIREIARVAFEVNETVENIGARRLLTVMEKLLDEISYTASDRNGETITITADMVQKNVAALAKNADLSRFIL
jgi:ATP-dependent HslUV protease ATP-binding subunit HslU